jgi:hypothetical protein
MARFEVEAPFQTSEEIRTDSETDKRNSELEWERNRIRTRA